MAERILIVEDDAALGEGLRLTLERYDCTVAPTLAAARQALAAGGWGLMILDLNLPDGSGLALLLALAVSAAAGALAGPAVEKLFWFFTYRFTAAPLLALLLVFLLLGCVVPLASYRAAARQTVVERLRAAD